MDQDVTKLREELDDARKEWRKAKYLNNGDKKKQSCLLRVQAAERALELYGTNNAVAGAHVPERSSKEISSTNQRGASVPSLDTGLSIEAKKEIIEGLNFDGQQDGIEGSNRENAMDVDAIFAMQKPKANNKDSMSGQNMGVDTPLQPAPGTSAEILNTSPTPVLAKGHSSSIQQQSSVSSVNTTQDILPVSENLVHEPMDVDTIGAAVPSAQDPSAGSVNELSNKVFAQGDPTAPSSDTSARESQSAAANMNMEPGESHPLGDTVVAQSHVMGSDIVSPLTQNESSSPYHDAQNDTAAENMNTAMDSLLKGSAKAVNLDLADGKVSVSVTGPPTYRVIAPTFNPQPVAKTVPIPQNGWTPKGQHNQDTFVFPGAPITIDNNVPVISNDSLGMDLGQFHPHNDLFLQDELWTIPEDDEDIKIDDVEAIAPYSVTPESQTQTHRSDTEAIRALSTELKNMIAQMPNVLVHGRYTFKIDNINWGTPFPSYVRMASDSDTEYRLRLELYKSKASWMFVCAYKDWMQDQMQTLKDQATKGISDFTVFVSTWNMCEADMKVLSTRAEDAKKQMDTAQKAMDSCFKGKSRAVLEYAIEELQKRILSDDDISRDDLHLLRAKLMTQKNSLREIIAEEEVKGFEDNDLVRPARKGNTKGRGDSESDASIAYMKYSEEKQNSIEKKARTTFHNFARFAASANPSSSGLKALGIAFKVSYRRTVRTIRGFLPEAATTCRRSALLCLTTGTPNSFCLGHHRRHAECRHDSVTHFRGVAYPKNATARGCGLSNPKYPEPNHLHCGCLIDDGLLEFYFYKTITARSTHPLLSGIIHYMDDAFTPFIIRSFWMSQFRTTTGLTMDDIYNLNADEAMHQVAFTARMIQKHVSNMRNNRDIGVSLKFDSPEDEAAFYGTTTSVEHIDNSVELDPESESSNDSESESDMDE